MCQIENSTHRQNFLNTKHVSKMNMFASFSNHLSRKMSNALPVLVNALPTTLQISSRASTYRSCFEHFPFFTRSFSHHNTQRPKASACQKPFLFSCLQCHLHQSLQRAWKRLQSLCSPAFCGVRFEKSFYQEKCHKKFPSEPHQVLCFTMDTFLECWMFPLQALTGWSLWQLWWSLSSTLHLMPRFPLPILSWYPHSQGPCALNCSAKLRAAARGSLLIPGAVLGRCTPWQRQAVPADPSGDHITARLTGWHHSKHSYCQWALQKIFIIQKQSLLIWFWDRHQTLCPRIYWLEDFKTVKSQIKKNWN